MKSSARGGVNHNTDRRHPNHSHPGNRLVFGETANRFSGNNPDGNEQKDRVSERREDGCLAQSVSVTFGRFFRDEITCAPRQPQAKDIAKVVSRVRQERE